MTIRVRVAVLLHCVLFAVVASAQSLDVTESQLRESRVRTAGLGCPGVPTPLPLSVTGTISAASCKDTLNYRKDVYAITVAAGETIDITFRSTAFENFLFVYLGSAGSMPTTRVSYKSSSGVSLVTAHHTFAVAGTFSSVKWPFYTETSGKPWSGSYTLTITTNAQQGACVPNATTVCLLNNRFRVRVAYVNPFSTPPNQPGEFLGARLLQGVQNPDTALFGFSSAQAVEVVVRVQDTRPFAPRFDVYYGGMTDVGYTVTVTDTATSTTRQYTNTVGNIGGGVDRTSFPAQ